MDKITNKKLLELVDNWYTLEQKEQVVKYLKTVSWAEWGKIHYGVLSIGLGDCLVNLSSKELYAYYGFPQWTPNPVDRLIASVVCSLKKELKEDIFDRDLEYDKAFDYYILLTQRVIEKRLAECVELVPKPSFNENKSQESFGLSESVV